MSIVGVEEIDNAIWLMVYYYKYEPTSENPFWSRADSARYNIEGNRFSILKQIGDGYRREGKYEFLLRYPGIEGFNRWRQSKNPIDEAKNSSRGSAEGYEEVSVSWNSDKGFQHFVGLTRSHVECSYLDGSKKESHWYYSIGQTVDWYGGIPGFHSTIPVTSVELWVSLNYRGNKMSFFKNKRNLLIIYHIFFEFIIN